jgi:hypothetical protein
MELSPYHHRRAIQPYSQSENVNERIIELQANAVLDYAKNHVGGMREEQRLKHIDPDYCDRVFEAFGVFGINTARHEWDRELFLADLGCLLGTFHFVTTSGKRVKTVHDIGSIDYAVFSPRSADDALLRVKVARNHANRRRKEAGMGTLPLWESVPNTILDDIWQCLAAGYLPSDDLKSIALFVVTNTPEHDNINELTKKNARGWRQANSMKFVHRLNVKKSLDAFDYDYVLQPIVGDGACLYRSIAQSLVYRLTGILLADEELGGIAFDNSDVEGWKKEISEYNTRVNAASSDEKARIIRAVFLNAITKWVKFYIWIVMYTSIDPMNVSYNNGINDVENVRPMTQLCELISVPPDITFKRMHGTWEPERGVYYIPSLDLVVRYVFWIWSYLLKDMRKPSSPIIYPVDIFEWLKPLLAVPMGQGPFKIATEYPGSKMLIRYNIDTEQWVQITMENIFYSIDSFAKSLPQHYMTETGLIYETEMDKFEAFKYAALQSLSYTYWGSSADAHVFSSLFYNMDQGTMLRMIDKNQPQFHTVIIFTRHADNIVVPEFYIENPRREIETAERLVSYGRAGFRHGCAPSGDDLLDSLHKRIKNELAVLHKGVHYEALVDYPPHNVKVPDDYSNIINFVYAGDFPYQIERYFAYNIKYKRWTRNYQVPVDEDVVSQAVDMLINLITEFGASLHSDALHVMFSMNACMEIGATPDEVHVAWQRVYGF